MLWVLRELHLPHRVVRLDFSKGENTAPEYLKLNPAGKIPTLVHGDFVLSESMAICFYLCRRSGRASLIPVQERDAAVFYQRIFFGVTELDPYLWLADKERVIRDEPMPPGVAEFSVRQATKAVASVNQWLERAPYIAGDVFTLADVLYYHLVTWSAQYDLRLSAAGTEYIHRLEARSAFPASMTTA